jgi:hypothetical protein
VVSIPRDVADSEQKNNLYIGLGVLSVVLVITGAWSRLRQKKTVDGG